jgi:hypothetical protein
MANSSLIFLQFTFSLYLPTLINDLLSEFLIFHVKAKYWPPLWPSCQSSWLQIRRSGFDYLRYQIFWGVVDLERGPLRLVRTIEELLDRKISGSGLEIEITAVEISRVDYKTPLNSQKLALTSPTSGSRSIFIVCSRTKATELLY